MPRLRLPRPRRPAAPVRGAQLDPELDAALLAYCERRGLSVSEGLRELLALGLRAASPGGPGSPVGLSQEQLARREALRRAKRELLAAVASARVVD